MPKYTVLEITDKKSWEEFLASHEEANFLQSYYWGEFHEALGGVVKRLGFFRDGKLEGVMLCLVEDAKRGRYLTVPAGPIIDWQDKKLVELFVEEVRKLAKEMGCVFIRVRPQLISDQFSKELFKKFMFRDAPMHLHAEVTNQLSLEKSEEELLAGMRKTTRYEIKKAINLGVKIKRSTDPEDIMDFFKLQLELAKRQKFVPFSYKFLYEQFRVFAKEGKALLYSAYYGSKLLAQAFIIFYNSEAVYHYGVSTDEGRDFPGAYLIQWEAIKEAQKRGLKRYNFWGVAKEESTKHRFYKISIFKRGFGGQDFEYLHAQDLPVNRLRYLLVYFIETVRKKLRSL